MMWSDNGWWWPGALFMALFMAMCMVMMLRMMGSGGHEGSHVHASDGTRAGARPERILAERLARGEIDADEYERRLAVLRRTDDAARNS